MVIKKQKQYEEEVEEEEFEEEEPEEELEEMEQEEPVRPQVNKPKPQATAAPKRETPSVPRVKIGDINPYFQQVGYQVYKGIDNNGKDEWVLFDKKSDAEMYSLSLLLLGNIVRR